MVDTSAVSDRESISGITYSNKLIGDNSANEEPVLPSKNNKVIIKETKVDNNITKETPAEKLFSKAEKDQEVLIENNTNKIVQVSEDKETITNYKISPKNKS